MSPPPSIPGTANFACGVGSDVVSIQSTDGKNPGRVVPRHNYVLVCGPTHLLEGLATGVKGMAGLGRTNISLPSQFSASLSFPKKFALYLSSSTRSKGVVFFGNGPYISLPNVDASSSLTYTVIPHFLSTDRIGIGTGYLLREASAEYFIGVKSIEVNRKAIPINDAAVHKQ
ncbi:hypothetical protein RJ640_028891 [Escallonia rubra]|uniref:Xylanase inhibitor N-terminal domain-containing protein n=1 Tax=Escallonia rubra TaxID=112253 RepID=A0AA88QRQ8_9ASTE|nr:hypothetical protein RJ640_028891 [Escallonia rubra]